MYYTTSGSYRKTRMIIDYTSIGLTAVIGVLFILILFLRSKSGVLFPIEFLAGGLLNGLSGVKAFMNHHKLTGCVLILIALALLFMALITWRVIERS